MRILILISLMAFLSSFSFAMDSCENLFDNLVYSQKPWDLYQLQANETAMLSSDQVQKLNEETQNSVHSVIPPRNDHRAQSIPFSMTYDLLSIANQHPIVGINGSQKYKRADVEIGYCFGRATYLHLFLLKLGLQKESIRKVWAVGPAQSTTPGVNWGFHVAIMVYTKEKGWVVIDTNEPKPVTYESWTSMYSQRSLDGKVRYYITEPEKFSVNTGPYTRLDLGLTLSSDRDWYLHYFVDMLAAFRNELLSNFGMTKLLPSENTVDLQSAYQPPRKPKNFREKVIDFFWGLPATQ